MASRSGFDVAIVGASVAGCSAAILFAKRGLRVAVFERAADPRAYKKACTHFLQPCAREPIARMGIDSLLRDAGAVPNRLGVWTRWGWIHAPEDAPTGVNIRRETLDPLLRARAAATPGVTMYLGHAVQGLLFEDEAARGVTIETPGGGEETVLAQLVVGADGRASKVASFAGIEGSERANNRFTYFTYYKGVRFSRPGAARYWHLDPNLAYAFQNDGDVTLLGAFLPLSELPRFKQDVEGSFERFWAAVPDGPDMRHATRAGEIRGTLKLPNVRRPAAGRGVALVGDAALCVDPIWGTGCAWGMQSAQWLVDSVGDALAERPGDGAARDRALARYRKTHLRRTRGHALHIADFSSVRPDRLVEQMLFSAGARDENVAATLHAYLGRTADLTSLAHPGVVARCLWVNARHRVRQWTGAPLSSLPQAKRRDRTILLAPPPGAPDSRDEMESKGST